MHLYLHLKKISNIFEYLNAEKFSKKLSLSEKQKI